MFEISKTKYKPNLCDSCQQIRYENYKLKVRKTLILICCNECINQLREVMSK